MTSRSAAFLFCCVALGCSGDRSAARTPAAASAARQSIASDCSGTPDTSYFGTNCPDRYCESPSIHVPECPPGTEAPPVGSIKFDRVEPGQVLRVSGVLRGVGLSVTKMHCDSGCCNDSDAFLGVYGSSQMGAPHMALLGDAFYCYGYASMPCCKVDAVCERVVATGRYVPASEAAPETPQMTDVSLCVVQD